MFKHKNYFAIGAVVVVAILILSLPTRAVVRLKLAVSSLFLPLFGLAGSAQQLPADLANSVLPRRELLQEINRLQKENDQLKAQSFQASITARENEQLRALFGWQKQQPWKLKLANVIMRDPANWWRTMQIDLGSRDGIQVNQPVLSAEGYVVGRVFTVNFASSQVVLIGDRSCRISALVENPAHDIGVISAAGPIESTLVELSYLSSSSSVKPGQQVVTSGLGGVFPKGIPIGQVVDAQPVDFGLYTQARVKLSANLGGLEQVWVLFQ